MAVRLPTAEDLGRRGPSAARQIGSGDLGGKAQAQGIANLGASLERIDEKHDRFNYAKAKSAFLQAQTILQRELADDPDWKSHEKKYGEKSKAAIDESMKLVDNAGDRAILEQELKLAVETGTNTVRSYSRKKEADNGIADANLILEANRAALLNAPTAEEQAMIQRATKDVLKGMVEKGWMERSDAEANFQKWNNSTAEGWVAMQPPERREEILKNPKGTPAEALQPDQVVSLLRAAQNENKETRVRGKSQAEEDRIWAGGGGLESMRAKARQIDDPDVRDSVLMRLEARAGNVLQDMNRNDALNQRAAWDIVRDGGKWEDIPAALAANMAPQDALEIKKYLAAGGATETDRERWYELTKMAGEDPKKFAELNLLDDVNNLDEADFEAFGKLQEGIKEDVRVGDPIQTDNQVVAGALREMGVQTTGKVSKGDAMRAADFRYSYQKAVDEQFRATGKKPSMADKEQIRDQLMIKVIEERGFFMDSTAYAFEADKVLGVVVPEADRKQIVAAMKRNGEPITEAQVQLYYLRGKGIGVGK